MHYLSWILSLSSQEDLCESSIVSHLQRRSNTSAIFVIVQQFYWDPFDEVIPTGSTHGNRQRGGIFDLQPNGGQNYPTELTQNRAIRNDLAIPTESQAPSPSMLTPGSGERARRTAERGRQAERVAVAIFYNKTHLRVTTTTAATREEGTSSSVVDMAFELPARSRRGRTFGGREGPLPLPVAPNGEIASGPWLKGRRALYSGVLAAATEAKRRHTRTNPLAQSQTINKSRNGGKDF